MIKINLLPIESFRQTASGQLSVTIFAIFMAGAMIGLYFFKMSIMDTNLEAFRTNRDQLNTRLNALKTTSAEAKKETDDFVAQLVKVDAIADLEERRRDQTRLLLAIQGQIINQASWLTSLNHNGSVLTVRGLALDNEVVAAFLSRLEGLGLLSNVELVRAARDSVINNIRLVTFEIRANTSFPPATLTSAGLPEANFPSEETIGKIVNAAAPELMAKLQRYKNAAKAL
jgi:type IV pilus assembly protein PilN